MLPASSGGCTRGRRWPTDDAAHAHRFKLAARAPCCSATPRLGGPSHGVRMTRFDSPVDLPYGMQLESARGQLKAAITEAMAVTTGATRTSRSPA